MTRHVVIVGAGQSGGRTAEALRKAGFQGQITLIGEERHLPYDRPPLSKKALSSSGEWQPPLLSEAGFYQRHKVELRLGVRAEQIRRVEKIVDLSDSTSISYDKLVLATGLRPRRLKGFVGIDEKIMHLRDLDDACRLKGRLATGKRVLVIGGGLLGLEIGATCRKLGCRVTITEINDTLLYRTVAPVIGDHVQKLHQNNGVEIIVGAVPVSMSLRREASSGNEEIVALLSNGTQLTVDLIIAAIGSIVNAELAEACGLNVQDGVVVNEYGQTSDPDIFAIGDISRHYNPVLNRVIRVESWHNAENQSVAVAKYIAGTSEPYAEVPWFWSDQFDMNLQIVGYPSDWDDTVVRGSPSQSGFTVFYLKGDYLVAANTINNGRDIRPARNWIANKVALDRSLLANEEVPLKNAAL